MHGRRAWNDNVRWQHFLEFDIASLKHPKQIKTINPFFSNAKGYDYGKLNSTFILRSGFGKQFLLFDKPDFGGIHITAIGSAGATFAFLKPVYLEIWYQDDFTEDIYTETERYNPYDPNHIPYSIFGRTSYFKGFNQMQLQVGGYLKAGINFEYAKKDNAIRSIETGIIVDAFKIGENEVLKNAIGKELPIMGLTKNKNNFFTFYINVDYFFGKKW